MLLMNLLVLAMSFLLFWAGMSLLLSCLPWFQRQERTSLTERLRPYVDGGGWVNEVEEWLAQK